MHESLLYSVSSYNEKAAPGQGGCSHHPYLA